MPTLSSILLVDDDRTTNFLHQLLLARLRLTGQVFVATDGQQALDLLPHLVSPALKELTSSLT